MTNYQPGVISLLVPSRGRPIGCQEMWHSALDTADDPLALQLVLYLDDDDPTRPAYHAWLSSTATDRGRVKAITGPRIILSKTWNRCWQIADGAIGWHGNDDIKFNTPAWDKTIRDTFARIPDRIALVHGDDGIQGRLLATHGFLHRRWTETVGYFTPPYFSSDWNDSWLTACADMLGRRVFLSELNIEHLHPVAIGSDGRPKAELDQTHRDRLDRHRRDNVDQLYASLADERMAWVEKLRTVME